MKISIFEGIFALVIGIKFIPISMVLLIVTILEYSLGVVKNKVAL